MPKFIDPYINPETGILRNLIGATTYPELRKAEGDIVALSEISLDSIPRTVDLAELQKENCLKCLDREDFVKRLAYFYEQLNFIHPFREGNGRAQRIFWQRVANKAGYRIDWSKVVGDELDNASLVGRTENNLKPLEIMFDRILIAE